MSRQERQKTIDRIIEALPWLSDEILYSLFDEIKDSDFQKLAKEQKSKLAEKTSLL